MLPQAYCFHKLITYCLQNISLGDDGDLPSTSDMLILETPISDTDNIEKNRNMHLELRFKSCLKRDNTISFRIT